MSAIRPSGRRLMFFTTIVCQVLALVRNIVVARVLGPHEFGIAAVIILTIAFMDSLAAAGPQNLVVQAKDEDRNALLSASHSVTLVRGATTAGLLLTIAAPISSFFGLELSWPALIGLSVSSLLSGFMHQGVRMVQRDGDFRPDAISQLGSESSALAIAVAAAFWTHSHMAVVYGLIARSAVLVVLSQYLSPQSYGLSWQKSYLARFWSFGWPLLINGPLLFFSAQSDRLFISRELGLAALGAYSAAMVLISSPSNAIMRWLGTTYTPSLAKYFHDTGGLRTRGVVFKFTALFVAAGFAMFAGFSVFGSEVVHILFGSDYAMTASVAGLVSLLQILRFLRAWPSTLSISAGASRGILASTVIRLLALPIGYGGLALIGGLNGLLLGFIVGEVVALLASHWIINRNANRPAAAGVLTTATFCGLAALLLGAMQVTGLGMVARVALLGGALAVGLALLLLTISPTGSRQIAVMLASRIRRRLGG